MIVFMRGISSILFLIVDVLAMSIYLKTKKKTNIWLLVVITLILLSIESFSNALEWKGIYPNTADYIGEVLITAISFIWLWISCKFITIKNGKEEHK